MPEMEWPGSETPRPMPPELFIFRRRTQERAGLEEDVSTMGRRHKQKTPTTRQRQILDLIEEGVLTPSAIAERMGISRSNARVILWKMRRAGFNVPVVRNGIPIFGHLVNVVLANELHEKIEQQAQERGVSADDLVRRMLVAIIEDNLFDAVIDADEEK